MVGVGDFLVANVVCSFGAEAIVNGIANVINAIERVKVIIHCILAGYRERFFGKYSRSSELCFGSR